MSKGDFYSGYEVAMLYKVIGNFSDLFFPYIIVNTHYADAEKQPKMLTLTSTFVPYLFHFLKS